MDPAFGEDEVVVSGIAGKFPESDNLDQLGENLFAGVNMVTADNPRWHPGSLGVPYEVGKMKALMRFDAQYFGITRKQCHALDPITRQVLERAFEAILDAGLNPADLKGSNTCVFFGSTISETETLMVHTKHPDGYCIMGRSRGLNANRISYWLDLKGTSHAFDSTWASGLRGIEMACQEIKTGRCDAAIVATGGTVFHPNASKQYQDLNLLSDDGTTRSFDANARGYGRSEAVCVMLLQRARDAKRSYCSVLHAATRFAGASSDRPLVVPTPRDWLKFLRDFYRECKVDPSTVSFVEADGSACQEADVAEMNAVEEVFCSGRAADSPLLVGSVKSNLGHAEASSALCSVAKAAIAMHTGLIPANLNYTRPNAKIGGLVSGRMKVVTETTELPGDLVAVNSFGFGGVYGHVLFRRHLKQRVLREGEPEAVPRLVLLSGKTEQGLQEALARIEAQPANEEYLTLVNGVFSQTVVRHLYRAFTTVPALEPPVRSCQDFPGERRPVWFVFAGMGSQWAGMARDLMALPVFRDSIQHCHDILAREGLDLLHIVTASDPAIFDNILHSFVGIAAVQIALIDVLRALEIVPDGMIGHSVGEMAAAYADGCFSREQMIRAAYSRGKASVETPVIRGMMAAVGKGYQEMKDQLPEDIQVACRNGPDSCTLSGPAEQVNDFVSSLKAKGVFAKAVNVANIAYHSKHIADMGPKLFRYLEKVIPEPKERSAKWISSSVPEAEWGLPKARLSSALYHTNNLLGPVLFEEGCKHIPANAIAIEIAPHGLLQAILKRSLGKEVTNIPLTNRTADNQVHFLLKAIGQMFIVGLNPRVNNLYPAVEYPVARGTPTLAPLATWDHSDMWTTVISYLSGRNRSNKEVTIILDQNEREIYKAYRCDGQMVVPASVYLMMVWEVFASGRSQKLEDTPIVFQDFTVKKPLAIGGERVLSLSVMVQSGTGRFEVMFNDEILVLGKVRELDPLKDVAPEQEAEEEPVEQLVTHEEFYHELAHAGQVFHDPLNEGVKRIEKAKKVWQGEVACTGDLSLLLESLLQIHLFRATEDDSCSHQLSRIRKIVVNPGQLAPRGSCVRASLELSTDTTRCQGLELSGVSYRTRPRKALAFTDSDLNKAHEAVPTSGHHLSVAFVETAPLNAESSQLGYSGVDASGTRSMGVGLPDEVTLRVRPDTVLAWPVPAGWSLEDAATVPIAYSLAYYSMAVLTKLQPKSSIFVTHGLSALGLALIRVALHRGARVYTAVTSCRDREILLAACGKLKEEDIIVYDEEAPDDASLQLLVRTRGEGVNVLLNMGPQQLLQGLLNSASFFSQVIHCSGDVEPGDELLGTSNFLKHCDMYMLAGNCIANCSPDDKKLLRGMMTEGLESGVVVPLPRTVVQQATPRPLTRCSKTVQVLRLDSGPKSGQKKRFLCDPSKKYLILGGESPSWLHLAEWFVKRQAKHVLVVHTEGDQAESVEAKLRLLQTRAVIEVHVTKGYKPDTLQRAFKADGTVAVAIVLPMEGAANASVAAIQAFEAFCPEDRCHLVCILSPASKAVRLCVERSQRGLPTLAVLWDAQLNGNTHSFLQTLDTLLVPNGRACIQVDEETETEETLATADDALAWLPCSVEQVLSFGHSLPEDVSVTELCTLSPAAKFVKETVPLFLLPGIQHTRDLERWFQAALYPVVSVHLPHYGRCSVQSQAAFLLPQLKRVTAGPYVLVAENCGGAVAVELSRQLEAMGDAVHVILLSATPTEVLQPLQALGHDSDTLELGLLARVFGIDDVSVMQELSNEKQWSERLHRAVSCHVPDADVRGSLTKGLDAIMCRLQGLMEYRAAQPVGGKMTVVTRHRAPSLEVYRLCNGDVTIYDLDQKEDILNDKMLHMIHDSVLVKKLAR